MRAECMFVIMLCLNHVAFVNVSAHGGVDEDDLSLYLYLNDEPQNVYPVLEYKAAPEEDKPSFLFDGSYPHARVVEFYAHWCPHCQRFKPHFVDFARTLRNITSQLSHDVTVEFHAVSCVPHSKICKVFELGGYPSVLVFPARSVNYTDIIPRTLSTALVLKSLGIESEGYASDLPLEITEEQPKKQMRGKPLYETGHVPHFSPRTRNQIMGDAHLSLDRLLRTTVFRRPGPLDPLASDALRNFLKIMTRSFSASSALSLMIRKLYFDFDLAFQSESKMHEILGSLDPPLPSWSSNCRQHDSGYTCGLWTLFHMVTVGAVEWNNGAADLETRLSTMEVADSIRDIIQHFYVDCDECRAHFLTSYDACEHDRCNRLSDERVKSTLVEWKELPLWLYEVHNGMNVRLRRERIAKQEAQDTLREWDVQWPPLYQCAKCWLGKGRWNDVQVYSFLNSTYLPAPTPEKNPTIKVPPASSFSKKDLPSDTAATRERRLDEAPPQSLHPSMYLTLLGLASLYAGFLYERRKMYDLVGRHKKEETMNRDR